MRGFDFGDPPPPARPALPVPSLEPHLRPPRVRSRAAVLRRERPRRVTRGGGMSSSVRPRGRRGVFAARPRPPPPRASARRRDDATSWEGASRGVRGVPAEEAWGAPRRGPCRRCLRLPSVRVWAPGLPGRGSRSKLDGVDDAESAALLVSANRLRVSVRPDRTPLHFDLCWVLRRRRRIRVPEHTG